MEKITGVILAAGNGTRFVPLTDATPKPLIRIFGSTLLEKIVEGMIPFINKLVVVAPEKHIALFSECLEGKYEKLVISVIPQKEINGTGSALLAAQEFILSDRFFVTYGDDYYAPSFFEQLAHHNSGLIGMNHQNWPLFGVLQKNEQGNLEKIVEKPTEFIGDLVNPGVYVFTPAIFEYCKSLKLSARGELELTDAVNEYSKQNRIDIVEVSSGWIPMGYPWHLLTLTDYLGEQLETRSEGTIEEGVTLKGNIVVGNGSLIKSGAYLEGNIYIGEHCEIGPNCYIRGNVSIDNNVKIGNACEVKNCVIGTKVKLAHLSYLSDSIIGNNVNFGAGTILTNLRHDGKNVSVLVKGQKVDTGLRKFGAIIGDNVKFGAHTIVNPGRILPTNAITKPGEIIS